MVAEEQSLVEIQAECGVSLQVDDIAIIQSFQPAEVDSFRKLIADRFAHVLPYGI